MKSHIALVLVLAIIAISASIVDSTSYFYRKGEVGLHQVYIEYYKAFPELAKNLTTIVYPLVFNPNETKPQIFSSTLVVWIYQLYDYGIIPKPFTIKQNITAYGYITHLYRVVAKGGSIDNLHWIVEVIYTKTKKVDVYKSALVIAAWNKTGDIASIELRILNVTNPESYEGRSTIIKLMNITNPVLVELELYRQSPRPIKPNKELTKIYNETMGILNDMIISAIEGRQEDYLKYLNKLLVNIPIIISKHFKEIEVTIDEERIRILIDAILNNPKNIEQVIEALKLKPITYKVQERTKTTKTTAITINKTIKTTSATTPARTTRYSENAQTMLLYIITIITSLTICTITITYILRKRRQGS